jgi:hypothetical protein
VQQLPRDLASFRRALGFEKVADRPLKYFQCRSVPLFTDQVGAFDETEFGLGCDHLRVLLAIKSPTFGVPYSIVPLGNLSCWSFR